MKWDIYSRQSIDLASSAASTAFSVAKATTKFGFAVTRGIANTTVGVTSTIVDHTLFGGSGVTSPFLGGAVSTVLSIAEQITLAPIFLGEYITSTSLLVAHSSINVLSVFFPGSSDASFSLVSFLELVKREWAEPTLGNEGLPKRQFGVTQMGRAMIAWVALQGVTQELQEKKWFQNLKEINVMVPPRNFDSIRSRRGSRVRVTSDIIFPGNQAQIIAADIGEVPAFRAHTLARSTAGPTRTRTKRPALDIPRMEYPQRPRMSDKELKSTLRRLSKMVLAGYGGASLLFFGVSPSAAHGAASKNSITEKAEEERQLAHAITASEAQAAGEFSEVDEVDVTVGQTNYSWWDVLLGKHDQEIFERFANQPETEKSDSKKKQEAADKVKERMKATAVIGAEHLMPRFWVLTDHSRGQIVLVLRGTMSLNEIAVDLTCEPEAFEPAMTPEGMEDGEESPVPGRFAFPTIRMRFPSTASSNAGVEKDEGKASGKEKEEKARYHVHSGMLRMAKAMGGIGGPVQLAVQEALHHNPDYELVMCGHSLGAGVAAILGLMWADHKTCLTVKSSGLPTGRRVSVYCFAPPSLFDATLSKLASSLIVSFVYSHDVVARLSLGSIRDLKNAAMWLCEAEASTDSGEGHSAVTKRARKFKNKKGAESAAEQDWFMSVRKTLEANMHNADMFPPGRVLWAMRDNDLHPSHRTRHSVHGGLEDKLRLFEVLDVEKVFGQIVFARDMLSAHMPHNYDRVLHDLL